MEAKTRQRAIIGITIIFATVVIGLLVFANLKYGEINQINANDLQKMRYSGEKLIIVKPTFTETAYTPNGFYKYFDKKCDERCLNVEIQEGSKTTFLAWNLKAERLFERLNYPMMDDLELHKNLVKNPNYLEKYDSVILLHNEYVTREMFDAITAHPNVIYLYPNALYAQVQYQKQFNKETIRLVQGHAYPDPSFDNGFGWKFDNTRPYEFDRQCESWSFNRIDNGWQLDCYPELVLAKKPEIIKTMKLLMSQESLLK
jgi:hypothetical protein